MQLQQWVRGKVQKRQLDQVLIEPLGGSLVGVLTRATQDRCSSYKPTSDPYRGLVTLAGAAPAPFGMSSRRSIC